MNYILTVSRTTSVRKIKDISWGVTGGINENLPKIGSKLLKPLKVVMYICVNIE